MPWGVCGEFVLAGQLAWPVFALDTIPMKTIHSCIMDFFASRTALARGEDVVAGRLARVIFALDTARAMDYLHSRGIAHHDLKSR